MRAEKRIMFFSKLRSRRRQSAQFEQRRTLWRELIPQCGTTARKIWFLQRDSAITGWHSPGLGQWLAGSGPVGGHRIPVKQCFWTLE